LADVQTTPTVVGRSIATPSAELPGGAEAHQSLDCGNGTAEGTCVFNTCGSVVLFKNDEFTLCVIIVLFLNDAATSSCE